MEYRKVHETGNTFIGRPAVACGLRWRRVFPGEERQLGVLRRWLAALLPDCPAQDDIASVATELGANAVRHTASGRGGTFAVEIAWHEAVVRVTVADGGAPTEPRLIDDQAAEHGRGLLLVHGLSLRTGATGGPEGRLVWAEIAWDAPDTAGQVSVQDPYEAVIRDGEAALARRFGHVPTWFGRSTLTWWALAGPGTLMTAPSAQDLAGLLSRLPATPPSLPLDATQADQDAGRRREPRPSQATSLGPKLSTTAVPGTRLFPARSVA
jgi:hypothetical protein